MSKIKNNVSSIVHHDLCLGCGICQDVCNKVGAIKIHRGKRENYPIVDDVACIDCGLCLKVCPGKGVALNTLSNELFDSDKVKEDPYIGRYLNCYSGYSTNKDIRYHSASGGLASQFLMYLLGKKEIDGAVVVGLKNDVSLQPYAYIATNANDILNGKSSKYCVVSYETIISQIKEKKGKYVLIGLPCHIHGFRKFETTFPWLKDLIIGYFSIYCSSNKSRLSQSFLLNEYGIEKKGIKKFSYRDDGCMGYMKAENKDGTIIKVPYLDYYKSMRGFFSPYRCTLCIDHYGELADVCFGDLHVGEYKKDKVGINSLITRDPYFDNLLQKAQQEGYIKLDRITVDIINSSQLYMYKHKKGPGIIAALALRKFLGKPVPEYDKVPSGNLQIKYVFRELQNWVFRGIGKRKMLWIIIHLLNVISGGLKGVTKEKVINE